MHPKPGHVVVGPAVSVIIPVHNGAATLPQVLDAIAGSQDVTWECIVVDDASTDVSADIARDHGATVLRTGAHPLGPSRARNHGAQAARAPLLCFVDADVVVQPTTLAQLVACFAQDDGLAAAFGSYDAEPEALGILSQYRNLVHHYVHQTGRDEATTFWAGCGAIRRTVFTATGGFDPAYTRPSIEDIELGYRIVAGGGRIQLVKSIEVKHLKQWTFRGIVVTDIRDRAWPWSVLIRRSGHLPNDLNLTYASRASGVSVYLLLALLGIGRWRRRAWALAIMPIATLVACNRGLYQLFLARRGVRFTLGAVAMHWLYYGYSTLAFAAALLWDRVVSRAPRSAMRGRHLRGQE